VTAREGDPGWVAFVLGTTAGGTGAHVAMLAAGCAAREMAVSVFGPSQAAAASGLGSLPGVLFILILTRPTRTVLHFVFEQRPLVFLGRIFYAIYLWHYAIFSILDWHYGFRAGTRALIGLPLVFVLKTLIPAFAALMLLQGASLAIRGARTLADEPR